MNCFGDFLHKDKNPLEKNTWIGYSKRGLAIANEMIC